MELWFSERQSTGVRLQIKVDRSLYTTQSKYQRIDILQTQEFGKILVLDGTLMLTEKDEFIYHEMMVHVPMAVHPHVRKVLLIGAGDGGALSRLLLYPEIEHIDVVEIDKEVIEACRTYLPNLAQSFDDSRVHVEIADGLRFVRQKLDLYDLILVDSTHPFGPGEGLFTREFYGNCYNALKEDGILVNQHESPFYPQDAKEVRNIYKKTRPIFPINLLYQAHIPTYPSGHWLFGFFSKRYHPLEDQDEAGWKEKNIPTRYYNPSLHRGAFALPTYVLDLLHNEELEMEIDDDEDED